MRLSRYIATIVVLLGLTIQGLSAQLDRLPSREELDSHVRPKLSTIAKRGIAAERSTIEVGEIDDSSKTKAEFTLRNTTSSTVVITQLRSTCSCLKVLTRPKALRPNESIIIEVEFNPTGRGGAFSKEVYVYTSLDSSSPTELLTLKGKIRSTDEWSHLPVRMGSLRLSRNSVTLSNITLTERIVVVNTSTTPITLTAQPTISGLEFRTEPRVLMPNVESDIVISYRPTERITNNIETAIIVEGCGTARPTERMIKIKIVK